MDAATLAAICSRVAPVTRPTALEAIAAWAARPLNAERDDPYEYAAALLRGICTLEPVAERNRAAGWAAARLALAANNIELNASPGEIAQATSQAAAHAGLRPLADWLRTHTAS